MIGLALVGTTASFQFSVHDAARLAAVSSPGGTRISAEAGTEISLSATLSRSVTALDPDTLGAAVRSALADAAKQVAAAALKQQAAAVGDSTASSAQTALTLLTRGQVNGPSQTKAKAGGAASGAAQIRLLIEKQATPDGAGTATVTIAYVPPSETSVISWRTSETAESAAMLNVTA